MKIKVPDLMKLCFPAVIIILLVFGTACSSTDKISLGMTWEKVVRKLGEPDKKCILERKLLREMKKDKNNFNLNYLQMVYSYEKSGIQVWFLKGRVTDIIKNEYANDLNL